MDDPTQEQLSKAAKALSQKGATKGGRARASVLTAEERSTIARNAAVKRWGKKDAQQTVPSLPETKSENEKTSLTPNQKEKQEPSKAELPIALFAGTMSIGNAEFPCYVLNNGKRVIAQREVVRLLANRDSGNLSRYLEAQNLKEYIHAESIINQAVQFSIPGTHFLSHGYEATLILDICDAYLRARDDDALLVSQRAIAKQAEIITRACAKIGIIALIDEATGYEKFKKKKDLQIKLQAFISEDMQEWARMFPEEFWFELARLEGIRYSPRNRPIRWGKYVMMFVYDAIDGDIGKKLREINSKPHFKKNHHQWLKDFGREKVNNQIQQNIAIMKLCDNMDEFRKKFDKVFKNTYQRTFDDINWGGEDT